MVVDCTFNRWQAARRWRSVSVDVAIHSTDLAPHDVEFHLQSINLVCFQCNGLKLLRKYIDLIGIRGVRLRSSLSAGLQLIPQIPYFTEAPTIFL